MKNVKFLLKHAESQGYYIQPVSNSWYLAWFYNGSQIGELIANNEYATDEAMLDLLIAFVGEDF